MSATQTLTLDDCMVTNWSPYFHSNGTLRQRVLVDLDCQICSRPLAVGRRADKDHERYTVGLCGHVLGLDCMRKWVREDKSTCPVCRRNLGHSRCKHTALPAFEGGAEFNIHNPLYDILSPPTELNPLCVICDGSVQGTALSDESDGSDEFDTDPEQIAVHNPQGPAGLHIIYQNATTRQVINSRHEYGEANLERNRDTLTQDMRHLSLRDAGHSHARHSDDNHSHHHAQGHARIMAITVIVPLVGHLPVIVTVIIVAQDIHRPGSRHHHRNDRRSQDLPDSVAVEGRTDTDGSTNRRHHYDRDHRPRLCSHEPQHSHSCTRMTIIVAMDGTGHILSRGSAIPDSLFIQKPALMLVGCHRGSNRRCCILILEAQHNVMLPDIWQSVSA
ncbi:hypothetical protein F5Y18DRAFT_425370 [Xylariaceae sp. FL1019]|nr:hypothetical protein F5Y18DRAFT_425370 [Xylariaceae sp. FL1019]